MKKRDILIDLTPLLDVILVLFFLLLIQNAGAITGIRSQLEETLEETEKQQAIIEQELAETGAALDDANERLEALSDWDNERAKLLDELDALDEWRADAEQAIHFVYIDYLSYVEPRIIRVVSGSREDHEITIVWATDGNVISNRDSIRGELNAELQAAVDSRLDEHPFLILVRYSEIRW